MNCFNAATMVGISPCVRNAPAKNQPILDAARVPNSLLRDARKSVILDTPVIRLCKFAQAPSGYKTGPSADFTLSEDVAVTR